MTRIVQQHPTIAARILSRLVVATLVVGALLLGVSAAHAAFTTPPCLAAKLKATGALRACRAAQGAKQILGKLGDLAKCETKFQEKLAKLDAKAVKAGVGCRYRDSGDGTVTDFDTGLQWEKKDSVGDGPSLGNPHDVDNLYTWSLSGDTFRSGTAFTDFLARLDASESLDGRSEGGLCFAGHCDWRLPTVAELQSIRDFSVPGRGSGPSCIDPVFGPTVNGYWSATTVATLPSYAWALAFGSDGMDGGGKFATLGVRAVRAGL